MTERPLNQKEQVFIEHYLQCWNATEAARRAAYKNPNKLGPRKLAEVGIQAAIHARLSELKMGADEVLTRLTDQARGSLAPFLRISGDGELAGFDLSADKPLHLLKKASVTRRTFKDTDETTVSIELYDAQAALTLLGKHHKLFSEQALQLNLDISTLTTEQLERIAAGENPIHVLRRAE
jgi:hypothetical protein